MSLFENIDNSNLKKIETTEYEAWIGILYACMSSDGEISESEINYLINSINSKEKFLGIEISPFYEKAIVKKSEIGQLKLLDYYCQFIAEEDKPTVFCLAVDIVLSDGELHGEEKNVIEIISKRFNLNQDLASRIIEVILIKNKGNLLNKE